jgi:hypothetical protein
MYLLANVSKKVSVQYNRRQNKERALKSPKMMCLVGVHRCGLFIGVAQLMDDIVGAIQKWLPQNPRAWGQGAGTGAQPLPPDHSTNVQRLFI